MSMGSISTATTALLLFIAVAIAINALDKTVLAITAVCTSSLKHSLAGYYKSAGC
jgi:hypothetical protein